MAGAAFLATHEPGVAGARYPGCVFHEMTGLWCPGCGLTRGTFQLLHGHVASALAYNMFTPLVLVVVVVAWVGWLRVSWGASPIRVPTNVLRSLTVTAPAVVLTYGALRNIPLPPLRGLAP
ncbi:MAG: hypothetical protein QOJ08_1260 [Ilumatobacteraceae bacterium]